MEKEVDELDSIFGKSSSKADPFYNSEESERDEEEQVGSAENLDEQYEIPAINCNVIC